MRLNWHPVLGCLCLVVGSALSAAVPTPDTMVVARSDDGESSTTPATAVTELTTEEAAAPIKLTEMEVTSNIAMRYAHTAVVTRVRNPARRAQEATFRVLLPETAFISSFTMILDGKPYKAYVKEKEEAKQIYNQAVSQGLGAAHVATKARDSNHFTVSVNVEGNQEAVFNLTYEELLVRRNGVYNHAVNLHPGALVPKLTVTVRVRETQKITDLRVPEVRTGNEIDASPEDPQNTMATIERAQNEREATITFKPDLAEQQRLINIYSEKTKETNPRPYRYYGYDDEEESKDREGVLGQFVVQYDVERPKNGEILVNDGYFVHFYAPSDLPPLSKHCVFVLDTSGSMMDRKIVQLREAMTTILGEMNPGDYFSLVEFASSVKVHELKEADEEPVPAYSAYGPYSFAEHSAPAALVPPAAATPENVAKAKVIVNRMNAAGGTNIYSALNVAVELIQRGVGWSSNDTSSSGSSSSSSGSTPTPALPDAAAVAAPAANDTKEGVPQLEPIIIFLTDGDPTVGETDPSRIINHLTEKNSGMNKATIFSLAFGEDADRKFLRKLSLRNDGFMRHIYEAADAALQLRDFYRQVASPLLADVKFTYPKKQVKADSLTKHRFRRYYLGSEAVVAGRVAADAAEITPTVGAFCGNDEAFGRKYMEIVPKAPVPVTKEAFLPLERLWAYLSVKQLLDARDAGDAQDRDKDGSPDKKALDIALKYSFVTPLTSLVVVKPNATDAVDAESVHKQNQGGVFGGFGAAAPMPSYYAGVSKAAAVSWDPSYDYFLESGESVLDFVDLMDEPDDSFEIVDSLPLSGGYAGLAGRPGPLLSVGAYGPQAASAPAALPAALPALPVYSTSADFSSFQNAGGQNYALDSLSYPDVELEEAEPIDYTGIGAGGFPAPPPPSTYVPFLPTTTPALVRGLEAYHLQEYSWLSALLAPGDVIVVPNNTTGADVTLKLSTDAVAPRAAGGADAACERAAAAAGAGAGAGVCVYVSRCAAARDLTHLTYPAFHCSVDGYAGVCCPKDKVDVEKKD